MSSYRISRVCTAMLVLLALAWGNRDVIGQVRESDEDFSDFFARASGESYLSDMDDMPAVTATLGDEPALPTPSDCQCSKGKGPLKTCCLGCTVNWSELPWICSMPRPGNFPNPPNSPGYFRRWIICWATARRSDRRQGILRLPPCHRVCLMPIFDTWIRKTMPIARFVEKLKRIQLNDCMMFSTGGNAWVRFMNEHNSRLTEADNKLRFAARASIWRLDVRRRGPSLRRVHLGGQHRCRPFSARHRRQIAATS